MNKAPVPVACGTDPRSLFAFRHDEFLEKDFGANQLSKIDFPKTFSCNPGAIRVSNGKRLSQLSIEEELGITSG